MNKDFTYSAPTNSTRFHLPFRDDTPPQPAAPLVIRCSLCPWHKLTTVGGMQSVYANHRKLKHGGK